jgi:F5/8 type C domain/Fibronectin type III domain
VGWKIDQAIRSGIALICLVCPLLLNAQPGVTTQHNDHNRSGWYSHEKILNTKNVKMGFFGRMFTRPVDDQIYSQPLVMLDVPMPVGNRNIVIVATVNNSLYAFDADSASVTNPYWHVNFTPAGARPVKNTDMASACDGFYRDYSGNIGIVGTPVIDTLTNTIYLVSRHRLEPSGVYEQHLHAIDILTGQERAGSPKTIAAQVNGNGAGSVNGVISFDPFKQNQRSGLLLLNGVVYIAWASHCTWGPYHGWLIGYDKTSLDQVRVWNTTPEGKEGGIWMSGGGPAADEAGNIYVAVANGTPGVGANISDLTNRGESTVKLTPNGTGFHVGSFFSPKDVEQLVAADLDLGVTGIMLIPGTDRAFTGSKDGKLYLVDRNNMGGFDPTADRVLQVIDLGASAHLRSSFAYYKGEEKEFVYSWSENGLLKAFPYSHVTGNFDLANTINSGTQGPVGNNGAFMSVSSNGSLDSTAILWTAHAANGDANQSVRPGILRAFAANDVTRELWNSSQYASDVPGNYAKFSNPTIANGRVYLATFSNKLEVYGLTGNDLQTCGTENIARSKTVVASSNESELLLPSAIVDGDTTTRWSSGFSDGQWIYVDLGQRYDLCGIRLRWEDAMGKDYQIQVSEDAATWQTLVNVTDNTTHINSFALEGAGRYVKIQGVKRATVFGYSLFEVQVYGQPNNVSCITPSNLNVTNIYENSATLRWNANGGTKFKVQYRTVSSATWTAVETTTPEFTAPNLACANDYFFQVQSLCADGESTWATPVAFSTLTCNTNCSPLPTRWNTQDIGDINFPGSACYSNGVFTLTASGDDIWNTSDSFRFAYKTMSGDGELLGRVTSMDDTDPWNKTGVMIRESLNPGSRHAMVVLSSGNGVAYQNRTTTDALAHEEGIIATAKAPYWVRLVKKGSVYTGYASADGITWTQLGVGVDVGFGADLPVYAGLVLSSHNINKLSTSTIDSYLFSGVLDVQLQSFTASLSVTNTVDLKWVTTLENEIHSFVVERSVDNMHYTDIDTVAAKNNGNIELTYTGEDKKPPLNQVYYRLRITDDSGMISYSAPVTVTVVEVVTGIGDQGEQLPTIYANPTLGGVLHIRPGSDPINLIVMYDGAGKQVAFVSQPSGPVHDIPVSMMANGLYVVEIRTEKTVYREKVMVKN